MEETNKVEKAGVGSPSRPPRGARRGNVSSRYYPIELRLKAVKLYLEEGFKPRLIAKEMGIGLSTLAIWVRRYREAGEAGLQMPSTGQKMSRAKVAPAVQHKIVELKEQHPSFGVRRISQLLRRVLFLPASHETVRRTLHRKQLIQKPRKKPQKNPPKPRFFERSRPNQMWQSDIFTFRLAGKNAYLIGFIDDYSRYVVGLDLFRSQTAEHVLEVYRTASAEYGVPKEMLTDNGRQYASWRGTTRFEAELRKDRIHHIRSRPHHPMTLGKIERFWKTIWEEFLGRAQFNSFDEARERVRLWVKYYNHRRPHQAMEGLCPADRFFEIASELRTVIEKGIAANVQELALRGQPQSPFYMVGRLGEQSVVIRAEKGQVQMMVEGKQTQANQELTYSLKGEGNEHGEQTEEGTSQLQREGAGGGGVVDLDGTTAAERGVQGTGGEHGDADALGESGAGRDAAGAGAAHAGGDGEGAGVERQAGAITGSPNLPERGQTGAAGTAAVEAAGREGGSAAEGKVSTAVVERSADGPHGVDPAPGGAGPTAGRTDRAGAQRAGEREGGGAAAGSVPQDVLQVGEAGVGGNDGGTGRPERRAPCDADRSREADAVAAERRTEAEAGGVRTDGGDPAGAGGA